MHKCSSIIKGRFFLDVPFELISASYGEAIFDCIEVADETLWVNNGEYSSQVNYCPFCGYKAKKQIEA